MNDREKSNLNTKFGYQPTKSILTKPPNKGSNVYPAVVHCKDCLFARERYGKLECINGISYRNTYNDPNMFCSYGKKVLSNEI